MAAGKPELVRQHAEPEIELKELLVALSEVLHRAEMFASHEVHMEALSVRDRMSSVLQRINATPDFVAFHLLFRVEEGRQGVIVTFLAVMELAREGLLEFVQNAAFAPIHVRGAQGVRHDAQPSFETRYGGENDPAAQEME